MAATQPGDSCWDVAGRRISLPVKVWIIPGKRPYAESLVMGDELAAAQMADEGADRARAARRYPFPVLGRNRVQVAEQGVPVRSSEGVIQQGEICLDCLSSRTCRC